MTAAGRASVTALSFPRASRDGDELWDSLAKTYESFVRSLVATLNAYGLLLSEFQALRLCRSAFVPFSMITKALGVTPAATTDIARRLEGRGLVRRVPNPSDRRSTLLAITPKGERLYRQARGRYRFYLGQLNRSLSSESHDELERGLAEMQRLLARIQP